MNILFATLVSQMYRRCYLETSSFDLVEKFENFKMYKLRVVVLSMREGFLRFAVVIVPIPVNEIRLRVSQIRILETKNRASRFCTRRFQCCIGKNSYKRNVGNHL